MKILVFGGFLGAGKTTVIKQMLRYMVSEDKNAMAQIVLLENEIGDTSVDDKTMAGTGVRVETLFSGCVCCTMAGEMIENIKYVSKKFSPKWIVLETTGMAYPSKIKSNIQENFPELECYLVCLADAKRWRRMQKIPELKLFSEDQLRGADAILVNKCDLVNEEELKEVDSSIREAVKREAPISHIVAKDQMDDNVWKEVFSWDLR